MPSHLSMRLGKISELIRQDLSGNSIQELNKISFSGSKGQKSQNFKKLQVSSRIVQYGMDIPKCAVLPFGKKEAVQL